MPTEAEILINEARCLGCASTASESEMIIIALLQRISAMETAAASSPLVYRALLTQDGTPGVAPGATVLENTMGSAVVWAYAGVGIYTASCAAFTINKTFTLFTTDANSGPYYGASSKSGGTLVALTIYDDTGAGLDGMNGAQIEILVYP